jgi:hypothetical protein
MTHYRVVIPDITGEHRNVNIGEFVVKANHLEDLGRLGVASLRTLVGGTQAGTTTPGQDPLHISRRRSTSVQPRPDGILFLGSDRWHRQPDGPTAVIRLRDTIDIPTAPSEL